MGKRLAAAALVMGAVWVAIWFATRPAPEALLNDLIADLRARAEPVTLAEMEAPFPPHGENGAVDFEKAVEWWTENAPADHWESRIAGPWNHTIEDPWEENASPEQMAALRASLGTLGPLFEHVDRGAEKPEIAWKLHRIDDAASVFTTWAELPILQELGRFLSARAVAGPTPSDRCAAVRSQLAIGARLRVRTAIPHLIAAVVHRLGTRALRHGLEVGTIDPQQAREQLDALLSVPFGTRFPDLVRGERARALEVVPFWIDGTMQAELGENDGALSRLVDAVERIADGKMAVSPPSPADRVSWIRDFDTYLDPEEGAIDVHTEGLTHTPASNNRVTGILPRVRAGLLRTDAAARVARVALAAYEHRRLHGDWPAAAADLAPLFADGVPLDPYTEAALVLERDGDHLIVRAQPWRSLVSNDDDAREAGLIWRLPPR